MAARETLLVFWTGRDVRTNETIAPAVPIGELVDVLEASFLPPQGWSSIGDHLTIHHPLQAFSARNLEAGGLAPSGGTDGAVPHRLASVRWTFDPRVERSAHSVRAPTRPARPFWPSSLTLTSRSPGDTLDLTDVIRFWRQPVAWLVEQALGLWLREYSSPLPGREPLELDPLARYSLQSDLLDAVFDDIEHASDHVRLRRSARGLLPPGTPGQMVVDDAWSAVSTAADLLEPFRVCAPVRQVSVSLPDGTHLVAGIPHVGPRSVTALVIGNIDGRKILKTWIQAVALTASGVPMRAVVAWTGSGRKPPGILAYRPFAGDAQAASAWLAWLIGHQRTGLTRPLPFGTRSSWAFVSSKLGRKGPRIGDLTSLDDLSEEAHQQASAAAAQHWWGGARLAGDADHPAVARVFDRRCPILDEDGRVTPQFSALAHGLWHPLMAAEEPA